MMIDIHSHLDLLDNIDEIVERAKKVGLRHIITNGIDPKSNRKCLEISKKYDIVECAMGIYPRNALRKDAENGHFEFEDYDVDKEIGFIRSNRENIVAISEVGLDFVDGEDKGQIDDFKKVIGLSMELNKPIIIHSRKAEQRCIEILEELKAKKVVMHCFCGRKSLVKRIIDNKWFITAPTSIVRSQQFQDNVKVVPITQLFCETDTPYLSPFRDQKNEPSFIIESYKKIADIKQMQMDEVINNIYMNWQQLLSNR